MNNWILINVLKIYEIVSFLFKFYQQQKSFDGKGKYDFSTGTKYDGELKDGMLHGKGMLFFENGGMCFHACFIVFGLNVRFIVFL